MAYSNRFCSMFNDNFKILTWVLILFIAIIPNFIFMQSARAANLGGWTLGGGVAQGASTVYQGTKNVIINGADYIKKGTAKITPSASAVAKVLARGVAGYALSIAVEQLLGAVDWVLDAENNRILYTELSPLCGPTSKFCYTMAGGKKAGTPQEVCRLFNKSNGTKYHSATESTCYYDVNGNPASLAPIQKDANVNYDPSAQQEQKIIPLTTVAQKVISNAESGDARAQAATIAAAADIVAEAETDNTKALPIVNQLEQSASTQNADADAAASANTGSATATPQADPVTGEQAPPTDIALEFPVFCNWAPIVCEAAQTAVNFMTDFEPDAESGEVTIHQDNNIIFDDSQRINFSSSCPSPEQFSVSFFGATQNLEFSYQPLCNFMSMIKPFVVAGSYVIGAYIVMGLSRGSAD